MSHFSFGACGVDATRFSFSLLAGPDQKVLRHLCGGGRGSARLRCPAAGLLRHHGAEAGAAAAHHPHVSHTVPGGLSHAACRQQKLDGSCASLSCLPRCPRWLSGAAGRLQVGRSGCPSPPRQPSCPGGAAKGRAVACSNLPAGMTGGLQAEFHIPLPQVGSHGCGWLAAGVAVDCRQCPSSATLSRVS